MQSGLKDGVTYFIIIPAKLPFGGLRRVEQRGWWYTHIHKRTARTVHRGALTLKTYGDRAGEVMRVAGYVGP